MLRNVDRGFDHSHGVHKDLDGLLKSLGLDKVWLLMMTCINLYEGPDINAQRFGEIRTLMFDVYNKVKDPRDLPLFLARCEDIKADMEAAGIELVPSSAHRTEVCDVGWDHLKAVENRVIALKVHVVV